MEKQKLQNFRNEIDNYLKNSLLPFWVNRTVDLENGGFLTHFNEFGEDSGEDEKSLIAQTRSVFTYSSAHRAGYGNGEFAIMAKHGVDFLIDKMWDETHGGFYWIVGRAGNVKIDEKIVYGHSFAIYALAEYTLATGDKRGIELAEKVFDLLQVHAVDTNLGGYWEMFHRNWDLKRPGAAGGDRKTLDAHMHLMEAFTTLYECTGKQVHRRKLLEIIDILCKRIMHPVYGTGIPQFWADWTVAPQIKFEIVWGWDRFSADGQKSAAEDNTSYGHNAEFAWLSMHALDMLKLNYSAYNEQIKKSFSHAVENGIDWEFGGVFVEGSHAGLVYDREKEFWQQAETLIGMLDAYHYLNDEKYILAYENVYRFVFDKMINHNLGEWWPLMTRQGEPIWRHMSHSWKINYHNVRAMIQCKKRLDKLISK